MFLFLSKLLPLIIYPLGLSCLLMIAALILLWRRPRIASIILATALLLLWLGSSEQVSQQLVRSLEWQHIPTTPLPQANAIVVLGGATKSALPPRPWVDVNEAGDRVLYGAKLYREGKASTVILSGGRIEWKNGGLPESRDMAELMQTMGVPRTALLEDPGSLNTYQNAVNVRQLLESQNLGRRVLLVTSALHMPRSLLIFKRQGIEAIAAPTDFIVTEDDVAGERTWEAILLSWLPDAGYLKDTTAALKEYLGLMVYRLRGWL